MRRSLCLCTCLFGFVLCSSCGKNAPPEPTVQQIAEDLSRAMPVAIYAEGMKITSQSKSSGLFGGGSAYYMLEAPSSQGTIWVGSITYKIKKGRYVPESLNGYMKKPE